jgi:hypothetical protein
MKTLKTIDYIVQVVMLITGVLIITVFGLRIDGPGLSMYFFLGGWQMLSVLFHFFIDKDYKIPLRNVYLVLLGFTVAIGIISLAGFILQYLLGLVLWSPVLAIIYLVCCYKETKKLVPDGQGD